MKEETITFYPKCKKPFCFFTGKYNGYCGWHIKEVNVEREE